VIFFPFLFFARVLVYFARIHGGCCFLFSMTGNALFLGATMMAERVSESSDNLISVIDLLLIDFVIC